MLAKTPQHKRLTAAERLGIHASDADLFNRYYLWVQLSCITVWGGGIIAGQVLLTLYTRIEEALGLDPDALTDLISNSVGTA